MAGNMKTKNEFPVVVTSPGGRVGGTNTEVKVNLTPTEFKGGENDPSKFTVSPKK